MTVAELRERVQKRLDEDPASTDIYVAQDVYDALTEAQQLFVFLSLCLEKTVSFGLSGAAYYRMLDTYADWLVPLRIYSNAAVVRPSRMADLAALDASWYGAGGSTVKRYALLGSDVLLVYPAPATGTLTITYAHAPADLTADGQTPAIPAEYHPVLADYACYVLPLRFGGSLFAKGLDALKVFLEAAQACGAKVRQRSMAYRLDKLPPALEARDLSGVLTLRKDVLPARKERAA